MPLVYTELCDVFVNVAMKHLAIETYITSYHSKITTSSIFVNTDPIMNEVYEKSENINVTDKGLVYNDKLLDDNDTQYILNICTDYFVLNNNISDNISVEAILKDGKLYLAFDFNKYEENLVKNCEKDDEINIYCIFGHSQCITGNYYNTDRAMFLHMTRKGYRAIIDKNTLIWKKNKKELVKYAIAVRHAGNVFGVFYQDNCHEDRYVAPNLKLPPDVDKMKTVLIEKGWKFIGKIFYFKNFRYIFEKPMGTKKINQFFIKCVEYHDKQLILNQS